jgi:hypothetical protein
MRLRTGPSPAIGPQTSRIAALTAIIAAKTGTPTRSASLDGGAGRTVCGPLADVLLGVAASTEFFEPT